MLSQSVGVTPAQNSFLVLSAQCNACDRLEPRESQTLQPQPLLHKESVPRYHQKRNMQVNQPGSLWRG